MANPARVDALSVLVPEAHALGMLAAIRSLGRAGYRVHAASPQPNAIGFASRFAAARTVCPDFGSSAYAHWLRSYVAEQGVSAIVPGGAFLLAIEPYFEEFRRFLPISQNRQIVYRALSKVEVFEAFRYAPTSSRLLDHHPRSLVIDSTSPPISEAAIAQLGQFLYIKGDARYATSGRDDLLCGPLRPSETVETVSRVLGTYRKVLLQGAVEGRQAGVSLLVNDRGEALASNCFIDVHREATRRGTMSLRRTWRNPLLLEDALQRLRCLGWQGAAMLEYRVRDSDGSFDFIELNPRYWQSLHLDLLAGVDFPRLQMAWFEERPQERPPLPKNVICRDLWPGEISRMLEIWRAPQFRTSYRLRETVAFLARLLNPAVASDYGFPNDNRVYWHRIGQVFGGWLRPRQPPRRPVTRSRWTG